MRFSRILAEFAEKNLAGRKSAGKNTASRKSAERVGQPAEYIWKNSAGGSNIMQLINDRHLVAYLQHRVYSELTAHNSLQTYGGRQVTCFI